MSSFGELKRLAEACNPNWLVDTWWASCDADDEAFAYGPLRKCWPDAAEAKADMRFIAAANPAAVLELIAYADALAAELRQSWIDRAKHIEALTVQFDALNAEIAAMKKPTV